VRILGLDVGERRIGAAAADSQMRVALPIGVVERIELAADVAAIARLVEEQQAEALVLGLPISLNGSLGPQAQVVRAFGDELAARLGLPVEYWDERLSTVEAQRRLAAAVPGPKVGRPGGPGRRGKQNKRSRSTKGREGPLGSRLDALAAAIILQSYLDRRAGGGPSSSQG
jgi:putative Holliday junction resolvase